MACYRLVWIGVSFKMTLFSLGLSLSLVPRPSGLDSFSGRSECIRNVLPGRWVETS
ncbi:hypothetical protein BO71DRAFT_160660 [Aspergillus ellipticus CBS 707.79]|uniref:Uncharacterized protein n=1 Tax=Aspergillus ellipticus CBS 707.79 TaxID=1448320 RepID=A0A319DHA5_9EURO|nr:hypothetical protein BO71DRAFT_160660 [Aspergillus ellipticus CBS 707.79]